jgi:hypothetical protein
MVSILFTLSAPKYNFLKTPEKDFPLTSEVFKIIGKSKQGRCLKKKQLPVVSLST